MSKEAIFQSYTLRIGDNKFEFHPTSDGTGICDDHDGDSNQKIPFTFDAADFKRRAIEAALSDDTAFYENFFRDIFDEQIRDELDDPIMDDEELNAEGAEFLAGSEAALREETVAVMHAFPSLFADEEEHELTFSSNFDDGSSCAVRLGWDEEITEAAGAYGRLLLRVWERNEFVGYEYVYNDGASSRSSGYCQDAETIGVTVKRPTPEETAAAKLKLVALGIAEESDFVEAHSGDAAA